MSKMDRILNVDKNKNTVTCQGGTQMKRLMEVIDDLGLMLRCVPSYVETTVAGCIGTATHSSGMKTHGLCDYVESLVVVDSHGEKHVYSVDRDPKLVRLAACHLGVLGIVVEVTLRLEAEEMWRLVSSALSLSEAKRAALHMKYVNKYEYYRLWWVPHTTMCYQSFGFRFNRSQSRTNEALYRRWVSKEKSTWTRLVRALKDNWLRHTAVQCSLWLTCTFPSLQPVVNKLYQMIFYGSPAEQFGSTMEVFTFDCLFKQWANEWAIDAEKAPEVLRRLEKMISDHKLKLHFPVEFRFSPADDSALSPAAGRATCWVGVVMYKPYGREARDTIKCYDLFNAMMKEMGGRPHWAKYYQWGYKDFENAYGQSWADFLELRKKHDPTGTFVNEWFSQLLSETPKNSTKC
ncbi:L-gulonolactone oxidase [Angomonas deanei]|nr:L-gulonolactone oxidase [Angomonas deanei]|eukprot:EPY29260.1 L-gulonolactone oxidase [Angomonas deanei]